MKAVRVACAAALAVLLGAGTAEAFWFQTPSHKIACQGDSKRIRCDTAFKTRFSSPAHKPQGCDLDWGDAFVMAHVRQISLHIDHFRAALPEPGGTRLVPQPAAPDPVLVMRARGDALATVAGGGP
jgi:hypothetical protein